MQKTSQKHVENVAKTCRKRRKNMQKTSRKHVENVVLEQIQRNSLTESTLAEVSCPSSCKQRKSTKQRKSGVSVWLLTLSLFLRSGCRIKYDSWIVREIISVKSLWAHMWKPLYKTSPLSILNYELCSPVSRALYISPCKVLYLSPHFYIRLCLIYQKNTGGISAHKIWNCCHLEIC